jgi:hypothetical protein
MGFMTLNKGKTPLKFGSNCWRIREVCRQNHSKEDIAFYEDKGVEYFVKDVLKKKK